VPVVLEELLVQLLVPEVKVALVDLAALELLVELDLLELLVVLVVKQAVVMVAVQAALLVLVVQPQVLVTIKVVQAALVAKVVMAIPEALNQVVQEVWVALVVLDSEPELWVFVEMAALAVLVAPPLVDLEELQAELVVLLEPEVL